MILLGIIERGINLNLTILYYKIVLLSNGKLYDLTKKL